MSGRPKNKNETSYHGPRVVFSRDEIERLHTMFTGMRDGKTVFSEIDDIHLSICGKLHASLTADPAFTEPAK